MTTRNLDVVIQTRKRLIAKSEALIGEAIIATSQVAMPVAPLEADDGVFARENMQTVRNAMLGNFLDWCGVEIPNVVNEHGMPTSLLLSAAHGRDTAVLSAALTAEAIIRVKMRSTLTGISSKLILPIQLADFIAGLATLYPN